MLRFTVVPIVASGIVGRIVFICTRQSTSALLASGPIIFVRKIPLAVVRKYLRQRVFQSIFSYRVLHAASWSFPRHVSFVQESTVLHYSRAYHSLCPLPLSIVRSFLFQCRRIIRIALHDPESSAASYVLVRCNCQKSFSFWYVCFPNRRGHPITDVRSHDFYELSCPSPILSIRTAIEPSSACVRSVRLSVWSSSSLRPRDR